MKETAKEIGRSLSSPCQGVAVGIPLVSHGITGFYSRSYNPRIDCGKQEGPGSVRLYVYQHLSHRLPSSSVDPLIIGVMHMKQDSVFLYKFKRLIEELEKKQGRGTELVTIYVPPGRSISSVISYLRQELATASNIKSRTTRHNVQDAIESAIQRLKLFSDPGPTGLVVFSGAIPQSGPGTEKIEVYHLFPPEPINIFLYRCDSKFYVEPLRELVREKDVYGVIVLDNEEAAIAILKGRVISDIEEYTSGIPGKHRAGGQSARRFERLREQALQEYYRRIADHANQLFLKYPEIKAVILAGPGPTKDTFLKGDYLHYSLRDKVHVVDTSYSGSEGVREAIDKAADHLRELRLVEERRLVDRVMQLASSGSGVIYGERQVRSSIRDRQISTLLISEDLDRYEVEITCSSCGLKEVLSMSGEEVVSELPRRLAGGCPGCGNQSLSKTREEPLIDVLIREAEEAGVKVELISSTHEAGEIFKKTMQGMAGISKSTSE